jgi:hypothetical protein
MANMGRTVALGRGKPGHGFNLGESNAVVAYNGRKIVIGPAFGAVTAVFAPAPTDGDEPGACCCCAPLDEIGRAEASIGEDQFDLVSRRQVMHDSCLTRPNRPKQAAKWQRPGPKAVWGPNAVESGFSVEVVGAKPWTDHLSILRRNLMATPAKTPADKAAADKAKALKRTPAKRAKRPTAILPENHTPSEAFAHALSLEFLDLTPSVNRIMAAELGEPGRMHAITLFKASLGVIGDPNRNPANAIEAGRLVDAG